MVIYYILIFIVGLIFGSFLNAIIYRLEKGQFIPQGRSFCPNCRHQLVWQDLIPLFSFFILKGKCRYCQKNISWQYPLVEFFTAILFLFTFHFFFANFTITNFLFDYQKSNYQSLISFLFTLSIFCSLIIIFVYDLKYYIIPDKVIYFAIIISLFYNVYLLVINQNHSFLFSIFSALGASFFFFLIILLSQGKWMGGGDVKLAFLMGLFLGFPKIVLALFLSFFIGAIIGLSLVLLKKKTLKSEIPFGPFLVIGTLISFFEGEKIISRYLNFLI